jgi:hypothetical protein
MLRRLSTFALVVALLHVASLGFGQVLLQPKPPAGGKAKRQDHTRIDSKLSILGMPQDSVQDSTVVTSLAYGTPTAEGERAIEVTTESVVVDLQLPGGLAFRYDSNNPGPRNDNPQLAVVQDVFAALKGSTITYRVKAGKVLSVEGLQKIISNASQAAADALKPILPNERISQEFEQDLGVLPTQPLNVGDSWTRTMVMNIDGNQSLTFDRKYEYAGTVDEGGKELDQVKQTDTAVRYNLQNNPAVTLKQSDLKIEKSEGRILFDRDAGEIARDELTTRMKGPLSLAAGAMDLPAELDLTITRELTPVK